MKYALISPNEYVHDGLRIAQVCSEKFEVAPPLYWIKCSDNVFSETHYYNEKVLEIPVPENPNKLKIETPETKGPPSSVA